MSYAHSMSRYDPYGGLTDDDELAEGSYFARHWRGQLSLERSYWVNGVLVNIATTMLTIILGAYGQNGDLVIFSWLFLFVFAASLALRAWSFVGIWRSAGRHPARGGSPFWAFVARGMIFVGIALIAIQAPSLWLQTKEYALIAIGRDPIGEPAKVTVSPDGRIVDFDGSIVAGSYKALAAALADAPNAKIVRLTSHGGRIAVALDMAKAIRDRKLETRVDSMCESACTLLFLAGTSRTASPLAEVGFHQPTFPGWNEEEKRAAIEMNRSDYVKAGIDKAFVDQIMETPPSQLWYPTHDDMARAGVLTTTEQVTSGSGIQDAQLRRTMTRLLDDANASAGAMVDEYTRLEGAKLDGSLLTVNYLVTAPERPTTKASLRPLQDALIGEVCSTQRSALVAAGAGFRFVYRYKSGRTFADFRIDKCGFTQG